MRPKDADRAARLELGGMESIKEQVRDVRAGALLMNLVQDTGYSLRLLVHQPLFTAVVVSSLAVSIGANTAVFSVVDAVLFRPLDVPESEGLAVIWAGPLRGDPESGIAPANTLDLAERMQTAASIAPFANSPWRRRTRFVVQQDVDGERISAMRVSATFFSTLGVAPVLGRDFLASDDLWGAEPVVVLGYGLWQRQLGGDPQAIGRGISISGERHLVIGIMPRDFRFPELFGATFAPEI